MMPHIILPSPEKKKIASLFHATLLVLPEEPLWMEMIIMEMGPLWNSAAQVRLEASY